MTCVASTPELTVVVVTHNGRDLALASLIALVEEFDLLEVLEGLTKRRLGILKLAAQFVGRAFEVFAAVDRCLGVGRIGKMPGIMDAGAVLLDPDLTFQIARHAVELSDHHLDLRDLAPFLIDLKLFQADERLTGLHLPPLPRRRGTKGAVNAFARRR